MENLLLFKKPFTKPNAIDEGVVEILSFIDDTKMKLDYAEMCLNFANDETLIDSIIYEILSLQKKYDYYLKLMKKKQIVIEYPQVLKKLR